MSLHLPPDKGELLGHRDHVPVDFAYPKLSMGIGPEQVQVVTKYQINEDRDWPNFLLNHNMLGTQKAMNQPLVSDVLGTDSEFRSRPGGQNTVCRPCSLSWAKGLACSSSPSKAKWRQSSAQGDAEFSNQDRHFKTQPQNKKL